MAVGNSTVPSYFALLLALTALLSACGHSAERLPYDAWRLGLFAPDYMEVWIETADAVDVNDLVFRRAMSGVAAINRSASLTGNTAGWPQRPSWGAGKYVTGAALPRLIYVRWQSTVEPQTYEAYIKIPEAARQAMLKSEKAYCPADGKWITGYRKAIVVGLAPGGVTKTWVTGPCLDPIEVARVVGTVDKQGPYGGKSEGHYYPLGDVSKAYVEKHGVPYGSW